MKPPAMKPPAMKTTEPHGRHLTPDEIFARVFPSNEEPAPVPLHLAVCGDCQAKVARLREGWLLDRGALDGVVDAVPEVLWETQAATIMDRIATESKPGSLVPTAPFTLRGSLMRRPLLALGSVAASLVLVGAITLFRPRAGGGGLPVSGAVPTAGVTPATGSMGAADIDVADDELLRSIDGVLNDEPSLIDLVPEEMS